MNSGRSVTRPEFIAVDLLIVAECTQREDYKLLGIGLFAWRFPPRSLGLNGPKCFLSRT